MRFLLLALLFATGDHPRAAIGNVVIESVMGTKPMILIAVDSAGGGGTVDYLYKFYPPQAVAGVHYDLRLAHVDDFGGQLVVSAPADRLRFTFVNEGQTPLAHEGGSAYVFDHGRGLACYWGPKLANRVHIRRGHIECDASALCRAD